MIKPCNDIILSTAYLPCVAFFGFLYNSEKTVLENCENYQKQSYRNRCYIYSSSGVLPLIVPVVRQGESKKISEVRIDNSKSWKIRHIRAIISAYRSAPYFEHYFDPVKEMLQQEHQNLSEMNLSLIKLLAGLIDFNCNIILSDSYVREFDGLDLRERIHPKKGDFPVIKKEEKTNENGQYHQVFAHKSGFIRNLSVLDLLFNEGPQSFLWLKSEPYSGQYFKSAFGQLSDR